MQLRLQGGGNSSGESGGVPERGKLNGTQCDALEERLVQVGMRLRTKHGVWRTRGERRIKKMTTVDTF